MLGRLAFGVWGLGFGVWGLGFGVWGLEFGVWGLGFWVWGLGLRRPTRTRSATELDMVAENSPVRRCLGSTRKIRSRAGLGRRSEGSGWAVGWGWDGGVGVDCGVRLCRVHYTEGFGVLGVLGF
jgi:hypothetical protein